jgi:hypothetical protein
VKRKNSLKARARVYAQRALERWIEDSRNPVTKQYFERAFLAGAAYGRDLAIARGLKRGRLAVVVPFNPKTRH